LTFKNYAPGQVLGAADILALENAGIITCTAATRPTPVAEGQTIVLQDQNRFETWNGSAWIRGPGYAPGGRTRCVVDLNANQAMPANQLLPITWSHAQFDADAFVTIPGATLRVPTGLTGIYSLSLLTKWQPQNIGLWWSEIVAGGVTWTSSTTDGSQVQEGTLTVVAGLAAGDTIVCSSRMNGGGVTPFSNLFPGTRLEIHRLGA
jgi:hypothetical protein